MHGKIKEFRGKNAWKNKGKTYEIIKEFMGENA